MDKVNFLAEDDYPVSTDTMDLMQRMIFLSAQTASLGGNNYILQGCIESVDRDTVSDGIIVINGELLPFIGGQKKDKIVIDEIRRTVEAFDQEYREAEIIRSATFSDEGQYNWNEFKQVATNQQLQEKFESIRSETPGFVKMWSGLISRLDETKYMLCDGRYVNTADYPDLAYYYGKEGQESFRLPDLRKRFIVGYDSSEDEYNEIGKTGGEAKHKLIESELPEHKHIVPWGENLNTAWQPDWGWPDDRFNNSKGYNADTDTDNTWPYTSPAGKNEAHENRPPFYTLAFVVRVKY